MYPSKNSYSSVKTSSNELGQPIKQFMTLSGGLCGRWFNEVTTPNCDLVNIVYNFLNYLNTNKNIFNFNILNSSTLEIQVVIRRVSPLAMNKLVKLFHFGSKLFLKLKF